MSAGKPPSQSGIVRFFAFRSMVYPRLIQWVLFPLWIALCAAAGFLLARSIAAAGSSLGHGALGLVGGIAAFAVVFPLLVLCGRVPLELAVVVHRIYDRLSELCRLLGDLAAESDEGAGPES